MIEVLPYTQLNGTYTVPDETVKAVFLKMVKDGTFHTVFYEGTIKSEDDFLNLMKSKHNYPVLVLVDGIIRAVAWINDLKDNHATSHFCVFKEEWGKNTKAMGIAVLKYWFGFTKADGSPLFDVILGVTPSEFKHAVKFISELGFKLVGEVPHVCYNAYTKKRGAVTLSYCERFP